MSKSLGNILDPIELIDEFGADAVRFTLAAMAAMGRDLKLSKDRIAGYRNFGTKLWNAARFAEMNDVLGRDPAFDPAAVTAHRQPLDRRRDRPRARGRWTRRSPPTASTTRPTRSTPSSGARSATGTSSSPSRCSRARTPRAGPRPARRWPGCSTSA